MPVARLSAEWGAETVIQQRQLGTGHAVLQGEAALDGFAGTLLVLFGDTPLLTPQTLRRLVERAQTDADIAALGFRAREPKGYGRMIIEGGALLRIVEEKDAAEAERKVDLCFAGMLAAPAPGVFSLLHEIDNQNAQGEFYLTDLIAIARTHDLRAGVSRRHAKRKCSA